MKFESTTLGRLSIGGRGNYGIAAPAVPYSEKLLTYLRITDISDNGTLKKSGLMSVADEGAKNYLLKPNDIVFARTGNSTGRNYFYDGSDGNFAYAGFLIKFSLDPQTVNPKYIKYYCQSKQYWAWVQSFNAGSTRGNINAQTFANMEILLPEREQQDFLVRLLSPLDDKIELNQRINDNLERQAIALFSSLYAHTDNEVLFTDIIEILGGGTPKTNESTYWNGGIPFFTPKDVGAPYTLTTEKTITEDGLFHCNSRLYPVNTVFVTARGTVGKVSLSGVPMAMNQSCYALVGKAENQILVYFYTLMAVERLKHKASGAVFDAITIRDFASESVCKLSGSDTTAFLTIAEPIFKMMLSNAVENQKLATVRDSLLPKLMSGEIDILK